MTLDGLNYLNIFLMLVSAILARLFPFELFLFVYAVLGPLHYLTEISWLHDKSYYLRQKKDVWILGLSAMVVTLLFLGVGQEKFVGKMEAWVGLALWSSFGLVLLKDRPSRWYWILGLGSFLFFLEMPKALMVFLGVYLPTLVHVFIFTGLFLLAGALKSRNISGFLSLIVFLMTALFLLFFHSAPGNYQTGDYVRRSYGTFQGNGGVTNPFILLNFLTAQWMDISHFGPFRGDAGPVNEFLYHDPRALSLMEFIAFAYTYHYLNWFSKTSVIGWHSIPKARALAILVVWGLSIALYAWDYSIGLKWLFFLSFTHVLLEFPLDHLSFLNLGKDFWYQPHSGKRPV